MAEVIPITGAHLGIGEPDEEIVSLLRAVLARAEKGDVIGLGMYWIEGQNDILLDVKAGCARAALMVSGAWKLFKETDQRWS